MVIDNFYTNVLKDYEHCLDIFFDPSSGAVYEPGRDDGTPKFLFSEVTGYAILDFLLLHSITGNRDYLFKARKAADWIIEQAQDHCGGVLTRYYFDKDEKPELLSTSFYGRRIFSFDTAICLKALVALFNITRNSYYLDAALKMGHFLISKMIKANGEVQAIFNASTDTILEAEPKKWSKRPGAFLTKVAEALVDLFDATKDDAYREVSEAICKNSLCFQAPTGNFETSSGLTELHPHCYAAEGFLHVGRKTGEEEFIESARLATEWALEQCKNGEISQSFDFTTTTALTQFRTDALAQTLALAADLLQIGKLNDKYTGALDELTTKILTMRSEADRYFRYGYYEKEHMGQLEAKTRSYWTNMFCLRGLYKYYRANLLAQTRVVVLAGGLGSRCWPISCEVRPKALSFSLLGNRSLLQETLSRYMDDVFLKPAQAFILCNEKSKPEMRSQVEEMKIPSENFVAEVEPKGTIPAVCLALEKTRGFSEKSDALVVVSMSDNVILPYEDFQGAVTAALFLANENDCIVSIGKAIDKTLDFDERFGHMIYKDRLKSYRCFEVDFFKEKPDMENFERLKSLEGQLAWECGTLVFRESYFQKIVGDTPLMGNLAENLLSKAAAWDFAKPHNVKVALSLLEEKTRFEDFGVPGLNLLKFYKGDCRRDCGNNNVCLGVSPNVQMLFCSNNLVISDELPIKMYGLSGYAIIDNAMTNTTVVMPLEEVDHLPDLYRLFDGVKRYAPFIKGGSEARRAKSDSFAENSPQVSIRSEFGLVFVYKCGDKISIQRSSECLSIVNTGLPSIDVEDFEILFQKQSDDPKLVDHLIHVAILANALVDEDLIVLSNLAKKTLTLLCLYHDFGGYLSEEKERKEAQTIEAFKKLSRLDHRLLDSHIIHELLKSYEGHSSLVDDSTVGLLNDNVNSAVEFIRKRKLQDPNVRDLVLFLLQVQDNPSLFVLFKKYFKGVASLESQIDKIFACLKLADKFANGRWLWKRKKYSMANLDYQGFLQFDKGALEDFPFIIAFAVEWFLKAEIDPRIYLNRLNDCLMDDWSSFSRLIFLLQENRPLLICDELYLYFLREREPTESQIQTLLEKGIQSIASQHDQFFQLTQIREFPVNLKKIQPYSDVLQEKHVKLSEDAVTEIYHNHYKFFDRYTRT